MAFIRGFARIASEGVTQTFYNMMKKSGGPRTVTKLPKHFAQEAAPAAEGAAKEAGKLAKTAHKAAEFSKQIPFNISGKVFGKPTGQSSSKGVGLGNPTGQAVGELIAGGSQSSSGVGLASVAGLVGGTTIATVLNEERKEENVVIRPLFIHYYDPPPFEKEEVKPEKSVEATSKLSGKEAPQKAVVRQNHYENNPEDVTFLIAGGTGDIAFYTIIHALKMGASVTFTSRHKNALEQPEMEDLLKQLNPEERSRLKCVWVEKPEDEDWVKLMSQVSKGKKEVQFVDLLGVPVQENSKEAFDQAVQRTSTLASAASAFEKQQGKDGVRVQFQIASSSAVVMMKEEGYAAFQKAREIAVLGNGPSNTTIVRVPYVDGPEEHITKSTSFGLKLSAFTPQQMTMGLPDVKLPVCHARDVGKLFTSCVDGQFCVNAGKMTSQAELIQSMTQAFGNKVNMINLNLRTAEALTKFINLGHSVPYVIEGLKQSMENPVEVVDDPNFDQLLGRPHIDVVESYQNVAASGKVLRPPDLHLHVRLLKEKFEKIGNEKLINEFNQAVKDVGPEIAYAVFRHADLHTPLDWLGFAKEMHKIAQEEGLKLPSMSEYVAQTLNSIFKDRHLSDIVV